MHQKIGGFPEHSVLDFNVIYVHRVQVKFPNSFQTASHICAYLFLF